MIRCDGWVRILHGRDGDSLKYVLRAEVMKLHNEVQVTGTSV